VRAAGIAGPGPDRHVSPDLESATELVLSGAVAAAALSAASSATPENRAATDGEDDHVAR